MALYHVRTSIWNKIAKPELYASHKREEREHWAWKRAWCPLPLPLCEPFKKISSEMNLFPLLPFVFFVFKVLSDFCFCFSSRPSHYLGVKSQYQNPPSRRDSVTSLHLDFMLDDLYLGYVNVFQSSYQSIQASSECNLWSIWFNTILMVIYSTRQNE